MKIAHNQTHSDNDDGNSSNETRDLSNDISCTCVANVKFKCVELSLGDPVAGEKFGKKKSNLFICPNKNLILN